MRYITSLPKNVIDYVTRYPQLWLFALMKTLASNKEKHKNKNEKREIWDMHMDYEFENL